MRDLLTALALVLVIEGVAWAACPEAMQRLMIRVLAAEPAGLRLVGLLTAICGVAGVWAVRSAMVVP